MQFIINKFKSVNWNKNQDGSIYSYLNIENNKEFINQLITKGIPKDYLIPADEILLKLGNSHNSKINKSRVIELWSIKDGYSYKFLPLLSLKGLGLGKTKRLKNNLKDIILNQVN